MRDRPSGATANIKRSATNASARHSNSHSSTLNNNNDPSMLLARGYISRYLPAKPLSSLQANEIDKDLLHFGAYRNAVISYRQQYYLAVNNNNGQGLQGNASLGPSTLDAYGSSAGAAANNAPSSLATATASNNNNSQQESSTSLIHSLPVRIDPEEEKRLLALRRKIHRAECLREDLEQQYVSLRAHFVHTSHVLQSQLKQRIDCVGLLQRTLVIRSRAVGLMRARLQMVRDVHALLMHRLKAISLSNSDAMGTDVAAAAASANEVAAATADDALCMTWSEVEEGLKQATAKTTTGVSKKQNMTWNCTTEPSTPHGVPLLVSSLAHSESAPEKSIAFGTNGAFGANKCSLTWLPSHLPSDDEDDEDDNDIEHEIKMDMDPAAAKGLGKDLLAVACCAKLQQEAAQLQFELEQEHIGNESLWHKICHARTKNNEWVAMICLLRQETEAVMLRHAVITESDEAQAAAERKYLEESERAARLAVEHGENGHAPGNGAVAAAAEDGPDRLGGLGMDDDGVNDGDDEGSKDEEDEIGGEWEGKKRPALEEEAVVGAGGGVASRKKARRNE
ncbi:hypothetical protein MPSEU_000621000 [Mayamaea pseudoterrestris]|nr:hypothetical protein MPSEU_000621000 [Mayamaea pseudoterrestris]